MAEQTSRSTGTADPRPRGVPGNRDARADFTGGYHGQYVRIDVATGHSAATSWPPGVLRDFLGGVGLGAWLLLAEGAASYDALDARSPLAFVFSPLVGSPITTSAKFAIVSKSPLTDRINDSLASSHFALTGKQTGWDAFVLVGRSVEPSIVVIDGDEIRLDAAGDLWGQEIPATERQLKSRYGSGFQFSCIGPAGERLVRFATVSHDGRHAGRGGAGAILGSKHIKAVAVRGNRPVNWAQPDQLQSIARQISQKSFGPATAKYRELGTATNLLAFNRLAVLPTRNFQAGSFAQAEQIAPEQLTRARPEIRTGCAACTIGCEHLYEFHPRQDADSPEADRDARGVRMEYETLFALGPMCAVGDADAVLEASHRCDALGIDTISTGATIAFAMECVEAGLLDAPWLKFGDGPAMCRAVEAIAAREGLGDLLADGSRRLAATIGHDSIDFAPQVKGLELPGYEPRALQLMALGFAVGSRGADHNRSGAYEVDLSDQVDRCNIGPDDVHLAIETEDRSAMMDSAIICKFLRGVFREPFTDIASLLSLVTGWELTPDELRETARRIVNAKKQFNVLAGWTPSEDTLPKRLLETTLPENDRAKLSREGLAELIRAYNVARGWSPQGWPGGVE